MPLYREREELLGLSYLWEKSSHFKGGAWLIGLAVSLSPLALFPWDTDLPWWFVSLYSNQIFRLKLEGARRRCNVLLYRRLYVEANRVAHSMRYAPFNIKIPPLFRAHYVSAYSNQANTSV